MTPSISFVIPALNEEENIGATLDSIDKFCPLPYETIVVDHGSRDKTVDVATSKHAIVVTHSGGTIGGLRNIGARKAEGAVLIFVDADVVLTGGWGKNIESIISRLSQGEKLVTGSHCSPPANDNPLHKYWFKGLATDPRNTHVGTGHMIISRQGFMDLGGFDEDFRTGEDYEFCIRAAQNGYKILNHEELVVLHEDFPQDLISFIRREAWHGRGDFKSLSVFLKSKVAVASSLFLALHFLIVVGGLVQFFSVASLIMLLLISSLAKYRHMGIRAVLTNALIFYFYFWGRVGALLHVLFRTRTRG